jgi:hypothetical protein
MMTSMKNELELPRMLGNNLRLRQAVALHLIVVIGTTVASRLKSLWTAARAVWAGSTGQVAPDS